MPNLPRDARRAPGDRFGVRHLVLAAALLAPATARAELPTFAPSAVPPAPDRPFVFAAPHFGFNTPLGLFGAEVGVGYEWFRASAGAGLGFGGGELAAMVRSMTTLSSIDIGIGLGVSRGGALHDTAFDEPVEGREGTIAYDANTLWVNLELAVELPFAQGAFTRLYGGVTSPVYVECVAAPAPDTSAPCDGAERLELEQDRYQPYLGVAAGFRWPAPPTSRGVWLPSRFFAAPPPNGP